MKLALVISVSALWFIAGWMFHPTPASPQRPIWDDEQLSKANGALIQYLIEKKPEALEYDFPSFFRCTPWPHFGGGGLSCVWGVTYLNEDTQRFRVNMDRFNSPLQVVPLKREVHAPSPP